ncbi:MAG: hypothetical protein WCO84_09985 [bacterium]
MELIPSELFTAFNDVTFYDQPHKYFIDGKELISVTTLIHKYQEGFDESYWSDFKATQHNLTPEEVLRAWKFINRKGTIKGSAIHDYAENLFQNKKFEYPQQTILSEFGFDPVLVEYEITKKHVDKFYIDVQGKLIPIRTEMVVYDKESLIAGMLDILFYNVKMKEFQIWDWKSNKKFDTENKEKYLLGNLCTIEDCDLEVYSLQLEMYKQIIEKNTPIKLGQSYIVWFSHRNESYRIIKTIDRKFHVDVIFNERKQQLIA